MTFVIEQPSTRSAVASLLRNVLIGVLSILSAMTIREVLIEATAYITPPGTKQKLVFVSFIAALVLLVTIIVVTVWQ